MRLPDFGYREVSQAIQKKVLSRARAGKEMQGYYELDGMERFRVTFPKEHSGRSIPPGTMNAIVKSLHINREDFSLLVKCPLSSADYEARIRAKIQEGTL